MKVTQASINIEPSQTADLSAAQRASSPSEAKAAAETSSTTESSSKGIHVNISSKGKSKLAAEAGADGASKSSSNSDAVAKQIEKLKKKIAEIKAQISKVQQDNSLSPEKKKEKINGLQTQLNAYTATLNNLNQKKLSSQQNSSATNTSKAS